MERTRTMKRKTSRLISIIMVVVMLMGITAVGAYATDESGANTSETVIITFDANGGTGTMKPMKVSANVAVQLPDSEFIPAEGWAYQGWEYQKKDGSWEQLAENAFYTPTEDVTMKAYYAVCPMSNVGATVTAPEYGANPATTATPNNSRYSISDVSWFKIDGAAYEEVGATDTFEEGTYAVEITFCPDNIGFSDSAVFTINGETAQRVNGANGYVYYITFLVTDTEDDPSDDPADDPSDNPTDDPASDDSDKEDKDADETDKSPQTADEFNMNLWFALMALCALVAAEAYTFRKTADSEK